MFTIFTSQPSAIQTSIFIKKPQRELYSNHPSCLVSFHLIFLYIFPWFLYNIEMHLGNLVWDKTQSLSLLFAQLPPPQSGHQWGAEAGPQGIGQAEAISLSLKAILQLSLLLKSQCKPCPSSPLVWPFTVPILLIRGTLLWEAQ